MLTINETSTFSKWFTQLRDANARARINARIRRAELGNFGDCAPVGEGVSEMRCHLVRVIVCTLFNENMTLSFCSQAAINPHKAKILKPHCNWQVNYRRPS